MKKETEYEKAYWSMDECIVALIRMFECPFDR